MTELSAIVDRLRATVTGGRTDRVWRLARLRQVRRLLSERTDDISAALASDLGKARAEAALSEVGAVVGEIDTLIALVRRERRRRRVRVPLLVQPARGWVRREPYGVVLVVAPWNYPINLTLAPLVGALAAGNTVLLKPSELAPATSTMLASLLPQYLSADDVAVVEGGAEVTGELLACKFDLIVYTGGPRVGRIVAEAAAKQLTPTVLELGGKSPVWVDGSTDLMVAARRIIWAKLMNCGQTCVAPDYLLCAPEVAEQLVPLLHRAIGEFYGPDPQCSVDYGRMINADAAARVRALASLTPAPSTDPCYVPPTILTGDAVGPALEQEIFGPVLPILTLPGPDPVGAAIDYIRQGSKPLALYIFSGSKTTRQRFEHQTSSGAIGFGVAILHQVVPQLPFGGVGGSGYGTYHGPWSLETFSHPKAILDKPLRPDTLRAVYPPFGALARWMARCQLRR